MSVFELVAKAVGLERVPAVKAAAVVDTPYTWPVWRENSTWTDSTLAGYTEAGYQGNALVYACIARKAESAAFAPLVVYAGDRDKPERAPDTMPLAALLLRPNVYQSWYEFMELLITYLELDGNAFILKTLAGRGGGTAPITALWPLRSDRVRPVPKNGQLLGYVYEPETGAGTPDTYLPDEIIHVKYPNPADSFEGLGRGTSPLAAAAKPTDVDNAATSFLKNFFDNAVVPFGLLKTKQTLIDPEVARIRARLKAQYGGQQNWGDVMILDADAEYQRLGLTMNELSFDVLDARNEARICMVLKVPPIIAGAKIGLDRSTFANYGEARASFWEDSLIPGIYKRFEDAFSGGLAPHFPGYWVAFDYSGVPALRQDTNAKWEIAVRAFLGGIARRNEARALIDLEPVPPEEDGFRAAEEQQIGAPAISRTPPRVGSAAEDETVNPGDEDMLDAEDDDQEGEKARPFTRDDGRDAERRIIERRGARGILRALRAQLRAAVPAHTTAENLAGAEQRLSEGSSGLRDAVYAMMRDAARLGVETAEEQIDEMVGGQKAEIGIDWTLINADVLRWLDGYIFDLVRNIDANTQRVLREAIQRWVQNGLPLPELIKELTPTFGAKRAAKIAATEVTRSYAQANLQAWRASGVVEGMVVKCANDERVCDICSALAGIEYGEDGAVPTSIAEQRLNAQVVGLDEPFVHPGGNGSQARWAGKEFRAPPFHVLCRCWLSPVIMRR